MTVINPAYNGMDLKATPFVKELNAVAGGVVNNSCFTMHLELHCGGEVYIPFTISSYSVTKDFIGCFYPVLAVEFQISALHKEVLIKHANNIEAVFKMYNHPKQSTFQPIHQTNPRIKRYKAKLYLEESDFISSNNPVQNNDNVMGNKMMVPVKVQLVEKGLEELISRHVGGTYRDISGYKLLRTLIDYHANRDNDDVATMLKGTDVAPDYMDINREQIVIEQGTTLIEAMHLVNHEGGGLWPTGFSYFIDNNIWYIFPPYSLGRYKERVKKMIIVNLPKDRVPGLENTYSNNEEVLTILSTRDVMIKDKRESKKVTFGTGSLFTAVDNLLTKFGEVVENKLMVDASKNVNAIQLEEREDGVQQPRFSDTKLTAAKNVELSKFAPSKGFMMRISWEGGDESLVYPGMPVKVLYLERNQPKSAVGVVTGIESVYYPFEQGFPARKFTTLSYLQVFVGEQPLAE